MNLIRPSYEIIEQGPGLQGIYDMIERCGKVSYKSEVKGGDTAKRFVEARAKEGHGAVLEFGTVYLKMVYRHIFTGVTGLDPIDPYVVAAIEFYKSNKYSKVIEDCGEYYITTNYRVLVENNRLDDLKYLTGPTMFHAYRRYTVKFIADIGVGREFLRHRVMSPVQESTRYVNYTREKFGEQCTFVIPPWIPENVLATGEHITWWDGDWVDLDKNEIVLADPEDHMDVNTWLNVMSACEDGYFALCNYDWLAQQARTVLPLATKSEFVLCGFKDAWVHFFCLRSDIAATGKPHPQAQELANPLRDEFIERKYINEKNLEHDTFGSFDVCISDTNLKD